MKKPKLNVEVVTKFWVLRPILIFLPDSVCGGVEERALYLVPGDTYTLTLNGRPEFNALALARTNQYVGYGFLTKEEPKPFVQVEIKKQSWVAAMWEYWMDHL